MNTPRKRDWELSRTSDTALKEIIEKNAELLAEIAKERFMKASKEMLNIDYSM